MAIFDEKDEQMKAELPKAGLWPVMLTAFTPDKEIDWDGMDRLVDWYIDSGAAGLFTVCLSSEMYYLNAEEKLALARRVVKRADGRVAVVASGTFGGPIREQAVFVRQMADTGVDAVVCLVNQLAAKDESDEVWQANVQMLLDETDEIRFGLYECPAPYRRLLTPELLAWTASTGRFFFLKETSEQIDLIVAMIKAVEGTKLGFFNAHTKTLLASLRAGGMGYSGIAGNFYPDLFAWMCAHFAELPETADRLQRFFSETADLVGHKYLTAAKKLLSLRGLDIHTASRAGEQELNEDEIASLLRFKEQIEAWEDELGLPHLPASSRE